MIKDCNLNVEEVYGNCMEALHAIDITGRTLHTFFFIGLTLVRLQAGGTGLFQEVVCGKLIC